MTGVQTCALPILYIQINDLAAARETVQQALGYLKRSPQAIYRVPLLYILASVSLRQGQADEAFALYRLGIDFADTAAELPNKEYLMMLGLNRLALALLGAGRLDEAEHAVLEVYRYRFLNKDPDVVYCYPILAEIEMRRGHLLQAKALSKRGIEAAVNDPRGLPLYEFQNIHAMVLEKRAEYQEANGVFLAALSTARRWRLDLLPADNFRTAGESSLAPLYDAALQNAAQLYFKIGRAHV